MSICPCCGHDDAEDEQPIRRTRLDPNTDTIFELIDGHWMDTGVVPDAMTRWAYALEPRATPFLSLLTKDENA